jgi:hypothetical protein
MMISLCFVKFVCEEWILLHAISSTVPTLILPSVPYSLAEVADLVSRWALLAPV